MLFETEELFEGYGNPDLVPAMRGTSSAPPSSVSILSSSPLSSAHISDGLLVEDADDACVPDEALLRRLFSECDDSGGSVARAPVRRLLQHVHNSLPYLPDGVLNVARARLDPRRVGVSVCQQAFIDTLSDVCAQHWHESRRRDGGDCGAGGACTTADASLVQCTIDQLQHTVRGLQEERDDTVQQLQQLEDANAQLAGQVVDLEQRNNSLSSDAERVRQLRCECDELQQRLAHETQLRQETDELVEQLRHRSSHHDHYIRQLTDTLSRTEQEAVCRADSEREMREGAGRLHAQVRQLQTALAARRRRLHRSRTVIKTLRDSLRCTQQQQLQGSVKSAPCSLIDSHSTATVVGARSPKPALSDDDEAEANQCCLDEIVDLTPVPSLDSASDDDSDCAARLWKSRNSNPSMPSAEVATNSICDEIYNSLEYAGAAGDSDGRGSRGGGASSSAIDGDEATVLPLVGISSSCLVDSDTSFEHRSSPLPVGKTERLPRELHGTPTLAAAAVDAATTCPSVGRTSYPSNCRTAGTSSTRVTWRETNGDVTSTSEDEQLAALRYRRTRNVDASPSGERTYAAVPATATCCGDIAELEGAVGRLDLSSSASVVVSDEERERADDGTSANTASLTANNDATIVTAVVGHGGGGGGSVLDDSYMADESGVSLDDAGADCPDCVDSGTVASAALSPSQPTQHANSISICDVSPIDATTQTDTEAELRLMSPANVLNSRPHPAADLACRALLNTCPPVTCVCQGRRYGSRRRRWTWHAGSAVDALQNGECMVGGGRLNSSTASHFSSALRGVFDALTLSSAAEFSPAVSECGGGVGTANSLDIVAWSSEKTCTSPTLHKWKKRRLVTSASLPQSLAESASAQKMPTAARILQNSVSVPAVSLRTVLHELAGVSVTLRTDAQSLDARVSVARHDLAMIYNQLQRHLAAIMAVITSDEGCAGRMDEFRWQLDRVAHVSHTLCLSAQTVGAVERERQYTATMTTVCRLVSRLLLGPSPASVTSAVAAVLTDSSLSPTSARLAVDIVPAACKNNTELIAAGGDASAVMTSSCDVSGGSKRQCCDSDITANCVGCGGGAGECDKSETSARDLYCNDMCAATDSMNTPVSVSVSDSTVSASSACCQPQQVSISNGAVTQTRMSDGWLPGWMWCASIITARLTCLLGGGGHHVSRLTLARYTTAALLLLLAAATLLFSQPANSCRHPAAASSTSLLWLELLDRFARLRHVSSPPI